MLLNYLRLTIGKISPSSDQQRRYVRILQAILTGFADRGISMVVGFLAVPLSVGYFGAIWRLDCNIFDIDLVGYRRPRDE
jgi:hypothetical protein